MNMTKEQAAEPAPAPPPKPPLQSGGKVMPIVPADIESVYRLAQGIARAGWAPKSYLIDPRSPDKGYDPDKIAIGILHGMEVGFTPLAALQSIAVINGTPAIYGDGAISLVLSSGLMSDIEERIEGEGDARAAVCTAIRQGKKTPITRRFSVADAKKAGLWGKPGPWQAYPDRMLQMRARSFCLRDGFADVLRGLSVAEEVMDREQLVQGADGVYSVAGAPAAEPVRAQEARAQEEGFELMDNDGKITVYGDPAVFVSELAKVLAAAGGNFDEQWRCNVMADDVLGRLHRAGRGDLVERINALREGAAPPAAPPAKEESGKPAAQPPDIPSQLDRRPPAPETDQKPVAHRFWFVKPDGTTREAASAEELATLWLDGMRGVKSAKRLTDTWMRNMQPLADFKSAAPDAFANVEKAFQERRKQLAGA